MSVIDNFIGLIQRTSDSFIRDNIYMIDRPLMARAFKNVDSQYQEKVFRNMSPDGVSEVKRLMANLGDISAQEIESAQQQIISMAAMAF